MARFGLFERGLSEVRLGSLDVIYQARVKAEAKEFADPKLLVEEYRNLGRRLLDQGLGPEELVRYNHLCELAKQGKFELKKAA